MDIKEIKNKYLNHRVHVIINDPYSRIDSFGYVTLVDDAGQLHGTWGGLAAILGVDQVELIPTVGCIIQSDLSVDRTMFVASDDGLIFKISEGTGDNLDEQDLRDGFVDYIYYDSYASLEDLSEDIGYDGGMVLLDRPYKSFSVDDILLKVADQAGVTFSKLISEDKNHG